MTDEGDRDADAEAETAVEGAGRNYGDGSRCNEWNFEPLSIGNSSYPLLLFMDVNWSTVLTGEILLIGTFRIHFREKQPLDIRLGVLTIADVVYRVAQVYSIPFHRIVTDSGQTLQTRGNLDSLLRRKLRRAAWPGFIPQGLR